jgi:hypothetical protein
MFTIISNERPSARGLHPKIAVAHPDTEGDGLCPI